MSRRITPPSWRSSSTTNRSGRFQCSRAARVLVMASCSEETPRILTISLASSEDSSVAIRVDRSWPANLTNSLTSSEDSGGTPVGNCLGVHVAERLCPEPTFLFFVTIGEPACPARDASGLLSAASLAPRVRRPLVPRGSAARKRCPEKALLAAWPLPRWPAWVEHVNGPQTGQWSVVSSLARVLVAVWKSAVFFHPLSTQHSTADQHLADLSVVIWHLAGSRGCVKSSCQPCFCPSSFHTRGTHR